jgi:hypothetical protein
MNQVIVQFSKVVRRGLSQLRTVTVCKPNDTQRRRSERRWVDLIRLHEL